MLETLRRNSRNFLIYLIFGILIIVFVISFGPQSVARRGGVRGGGGCAGGAVTAATVKGEAISENSWRYGILALGYGSASSERARRLQIRERVLDALIVRELLAQKAVAMGMRISDAEVRSKLADGDITILGMKRDGQRLYFMRDENDETPRFTARGLDMFARNTLGLPSVETLVDEQKRELLAQKVRELVTASVRVSPDEVQQRYLLENTKVSLEYVPFSVAQIKQSIDVTPAEIDAYLKAHEADLRAQYDQSADRWKGRDKEVRVRDLFIKSERPASASQPTTPDPARAKAEAALAKIKAGQDFAAVVKATTPDAPRAGDLGWRPLRALRLGAPVADAVGKLKKGGVTGVIEAPAGYHVVQLLDERQGDLSFDQVKRDLAEEALRDERAKAEAKSEAEKALAAAKAGTPLDKQFPGEDAKGSGPKLHKASDVGRAGGFIPGIGTSDELIKALFDELKPGDLGPKVYEVGGDDYVVRLLKRDEPDMQKFESERAKLAAEMEQAKGLIAVGEMGALECRAALQQGEITFDPELVTYSESDGKARSTYQPCSTLR